MTWEEGLTAEERKNWESWVEHVRKDTVQKMDESAFVMQLVPSADKVDIKFATEIGLSIMLDKPILAIAAPGAEIPAKLRKIADVIVYADIDTEEGRDLVGQAVQDFKEKVREEE
jgi:hypothetical protein